MNVTKSGGKCSQAQIKETLLQRDSAEHEGYAGGHDSQRITENNSTDTNENEELLEKILNRTNLNNAYARVKANKGANGVDGMKVEEMLTYMKKNGQELLEKIRKGKYGPKPVRRVEIAKDDGKSKRPLGIPTVVDQMFQQAIAQVLTPIFEKQFSDNSYGFRPGRSAHSAVERCSEYIEAGYKYVVDMDLEKYFDTVNQSKLIEVLSRTIKNGQVISLIHKYLQAGVIVKHSFKETDKGVPQGGPMSPLLSNVMLNELDKELSNRAMSTG